MARILQYKPRYRPRGTVSVYLMQGQLVARAWRRPARDPKTARQLAQRNRIACASAFLRHFANIVGRGYQVGSKPNGRTIGAYQMAISHVMRKHTIYRYARWQVDYSAVQLAQGRPCPLRVAGVKRKGGSLEIRWHGRAPRAAQTLRIALYNPQRGMSLQQPIPLQANSSQATIALPKGWGNGTLHLWLLLEDAVGQIRWTSVYIPIPMGVTTSGSTQSASSRQGAGKWKGVDDETEHQNRESG